MIAKTFGFTGFPFTGRWFGLSMLAHLATGVIYINLLILTFSHISSFGSKKRYNRKAQNYTKLIYLTDGCFVILCLNILPDEKVRSDYFKQDFELFLFCPWLASFFHFSFHLFPFFRTHLHPFFM